MQRALHALILAAGYGQRLGSLTADRPKPMIAIGGKPILQHNVELVARAGIRDVTINVHHRAEAIRDYFGDGSAFGVAIEYLDEPVLLGTAGTARHIATRTPGDDFAVVYGDNLSTIDLRALIAFHRDNQADATIALFHRDDVRASGVAQIDESDRITGFVEKPSITQASGGWVNAGYLVFRTALLAAVSGTVPLDLSRDVIPTLIAQGRRLYGYRMTESLWWIDTPADYERTIHAFR
jgi:NDP-sugar pyrophosphorylase family protein